MAVVWSGKGLCVERPDRGKHGADGAEGAGVGSDSGRPLSHVIDSGLDGIPISFCSANICRKAENKTQNNDNKIQHQRSISSSL